MTRHIIMILTALVLTSTLLTPASAQVQLRVQVSIVDEKSSEPVSDARVVTYQPERPNNRWDDYSNERGIVTIVGLEPGNVTFEVTAKGYVNGRFTLRIPSNLPRIEFKIELAPIVRETGQATEAIVSEFNAAAALAKEGKHEEALVIFTKLLAEYPDIKELYTAAAGEYAQLKQTDKALELLLKLWEMDSENPDAALRIAELYIDSGNTEKATEYYDLVLKNKPDDLYVLEKVAFSAYETGAFDKAIDYYHKVLELKPENPIANYYLGNIYYVQDDFENALKHYQEYLKLDPENTTGGVEAARMTIEDIKKRMESNNQ